MYERLKWDMSWVIEYEFHYKGNYGAPGEKRGPREKATPEQIKRQNQWNRENKVRRTLLMNFSVDDLWVCLKYPKGARLDAGTVKKHWKKFREETTKEYRKAGEPFKFMYRMEVSRSGGVHIHLAANRLRGTIQTDELMSRIWKKVTKESIGASGGINFTPMHEQGCFEELAEYLTKKPKDEEYEQLSLFPENDRKDFIKYGSSRNLARPVPDPEKKEYRCWTLRRLIDEGPRPTQGFYIDKNSIVKGVNRFTGMSYYRYREIKLSAETDPPENKEKRRE